MRSKPLLFVAVLVTTAAACDSAETTDDVEPTFQAVVDRVLAPSCTFSSCHANPTVAAKLDLTPERACQTLVNKPSCLFPDRMRVVPGSPETSFFFHKLTGEGLHEQPTGSCDSDSSASTPTNLLMPYGASELAAADLRLVHDWIASGASCDPGTGTEPAEAGPAIASITTTRTAPLAGETFTVTVTLDKPAPEGGQMISIEYDPSALTAPVQHVISAGETAKRFEAYALRPTSRFALRVRAGKSVKDLVLRVSGLEIAEVLADPAGDDDRLQWVKLHNRSSQPLDLTGYRLQSGQGSYNLVSVDLAGTIPAGGCVVVGGPVQAGVNSEPLFTQAFDFNPNLPHGNDQAAGFAVFDAGAAPLGGVLTPVDTLLIGTGNAAKLLDADAEIATPGCPAPVSGMSALRTVDGRCVQAYMQPRACF